MLAKHVEEAVEGLIELGVLSEEGLIRVARLFAAIKALKDAGVVNGDAVALVDHAADNVVEPSDVASASPRKSPLRPTSPTPSSRTT